MRNLSYYDKDGRRKSCYLDFDNLSDFYYLLSDLTDDNFAYDFQNEFENFYYLSVDEVKKDLSYYIDDMKTYSDDIRNSINKVEDYINNLLIEYELDSDFVIELKGILTTIKEAKNDINTLDNDIIGGIEEYVINYNRYKDKKERFSG
jgi:hypothetical protein